MYFEIPPSESNLRDDINRDAIAKRLGLEVDASKPLLYSLLKNKKY